MITVRSSKLPWIERFWAKVDKTGECWLWKASLNSWGYGRFAIRRRSQLAHRVSWWLYTGRWPAKHILHSCDTPACVNPTHLREGTDRDNAHDRVSRGRNANRKGSRNGRAVLTDSKVRAILDDGRSQRTIAKSYGVSKSTIASIKSGQTWRHL